jgi:hypothetical protein
MGLGEVCCVWEWQYVGVERGGINGFGIIPHHVDSVWQKIFLVQYEGGGAGRLEGRSKR